MTNSTFTISAFGDEIADDLAEQLRVLQDLEIDYLELRGAWGKNVLQLEDEEAERVRELCNEAGITVSAIGSPIGKSPIAEPIETELANLRRLIAIGRTVGTDRIRVFSFYPPENTESAAYDQYVDAAIERLRALTDVATDAGVQLLLENEKGIVGDTIARCQALLAGVNHPTLCFAWDPANFVQVGEAAVTERGWPKLQEYTGYVHIKDAMADGSGVRPAGEGDGQVPALIANLRDKGYQGFLALEPHLAVAGHSGGFSGPEGMERAVKALRKILTEQGCTEVRK